MSLVKDKRCTDGQRRGWRGFLIWVMWRSLILLGSFPSRVIGHQKTSGGSGHGKVFDGLRNRREGDEMKGGKDLVVATWAISQLEPGRGESRMKGVMAEHNGQSRVISAD